MNNHDFKPNQRIHVIVAAFFDKQIFEKFVPYWKYNYSH